MSNLMDADTWMHMVLSFRTPLDVCEKKFREFSLMQDIFIREALETSRDFIWFVNKSIVM